MLSRAADRTRTAPSSLYGSTGSTDPGAERSQDARGPVPWPMAAQSDQCVRRWVAVRPVDLGNFHAQLRKISTYHILTSDRR